MKRILSLFFTLVLAFALVACSDSTASTNQDGAAQSSAENASAAGADEAGAGADEMGTTAATQAAAITITPSATSSTLTVTGQIAEYFIALTETYDEEDTINFCVQFETAEGAFADFRWHYSADFNKFFYLEYAASEQPDLVGNYTDTSISFTFQTGLVDFSALNSISVYLDIDDGPPSMYTQLVIADVIMQDEVAQAAAADEFGIAGYYADIYDDYALLMIDTDAFGYTADLNGTLYSLSVDESNVGEGQHYIATAEDDSRFCLDFFDADEHPTMLISEYHGEAEMRYTCEYEPLFSEVFYSYDSDLNQTDSTLQMEFDGTNIRFTVFDTYITDWLDLGALRYSETTGSQMEGIAFSEMLVTSLADGETYFLTLKGMARDESWYPEMNVWTYSVYKTELVDGILCQNALVMTDTCICDVQTDAASVAKINDIIGVYTSSYEYTLQRDDGSPYFESFEITENEIILDGNVIAQINLDELYGTMMLHGYQVIYDGDTPTHTLHLYVRGDLLDITMQEYGTVFVSSIVYHPTNNQTPTLEVTVAK